LSPAAYVPVWLRRGDHGTLCAADLVFGEIQQNKLSANDREILDVLTEMPSGCGLDEWRSECIKGGLIRGTSDAQKKNMQRSINRLKNAGLITSPRRGAYIPSPCEDE